MHLKISARLKGYVKKLEEIFPKTAAKTGPLESNGTWTLNITLCSMQILFKEVCLTEQLHRLMYVIVYYVYLIIVDTLHSYNTRSLVLKTTR